LSFRKGIESLKVDAPNEGIPEVQSTENFSKKWLFPTTLIESNAMKSLHNFLFVALFSLMSLYWVSVGAQSCTGAPVSSCSGINASSSSCGGYYIANGSGGGTQCKWNGSYCSNGGGDCGNQPPPQPAPQPAPTPPPSSGTVPTIAGTLTWQFSPVLTAAVTNYCNPCGTYYLYYMTGTLTSSGSNTYSISGYGEAAFNQTYPYTSTQYFQVPGIGSMFLSGGQYQMYVNAMFQPPPQGGTSPDPVQLMMNCFLSATTLSGECSTMPSNGLPSQSTQATLVK